MNKNAIKQLLNKGKLTGQEIGKLFILNSIAEITAFKSKGKLCPIITKDELENALSGINRDNYQISMYNNYVGIQNLATHLYSLFLAYTQQVENGFNKLLLGVTLDLWQIDQEEYKANLPLIMTEEQYKKDLEESNKEYKDGEASFYDLFFMALRHYQKGLKEGKSLLSKVYDNYKDIPVKDKELIDLYKKRFLHTDFCCTDGDGYYTLSDGRDSGEVTLEEYIQDFFNRPLLKKLKAGDKMQLRDRYFNEMNGCIGECGLMTVSRDLSKQFAETLDEIGKYRTPESKAEPIRVYEFIELVRNYFNLQEDKEDFIEELDQLEADSFTLTYTVDKQDLILDYNFISYLYEDDKDNAELLERYLKELPELEKILEKDIAEKLGVKSIDYYETSKGKKAKRVNYFKPLVKYEELYNNNVYGFKENAYWYFQGYNGVKAQKNGVAIAQEQSLDNDYKQKHFTEGLYSYTSKISQYTETLRHFSTKKHSNNKEIIKDYIENGLKNTYAIIAMLEDIEELHQLEGLKDAYTFSISNIEAGLTLFNFLKWDIKTKDSIVKNKDMLLKLEEDINYIDYNAYKPTKEAREKAREYLADIKVFDNAGHKVNKFFSLYFDSDAVQAEETI